VVCHPFRLTVYISKVNLGPEDLPLKALVCKDSAAVTWLSYEESSWDRTATQLSHPKPVVSNMAAALRKMSRKAAENIGISLPPKRE
jgi:hypothetical protein